MIENLLVGLVVLTAAGYAAWKLMPASLRARLARRAAALGERAGISQENAKRLETKLMTQGACGSCNSCNACATDPATPATKGLGPSEAPLLRHRAIDSQSGHR